MGGDAGVAGILLTTDKSISCIIKMIATNTEEVEIAMVGQWGHLQTIMHALLTGGGQGGVGR